ncbi:MAG: DNA polymerase III subunit delta [Flavobacterium sp.]|uniref:DNA polymerase III subunit delta n=1 Tax=Flavobacterium sp. TaxID=239 RepID=UPI0035270FEE
MDEIVKIINDIKVGNIKPIYFLMGEESYYIDKLTEYLEDNLLTEDEKGFNQMVLYGRDTTIEDIVSNAKRYPMMAERQVIIVKEAQDLSRTIDKIEAYVNNPQPTTVLVFAYKYGKVDKRKKWIKSIAKNHILFESEKLKDFKVADWIKRVLQGRGFSIEPKAAIMLQEFLGNDLSRIANELSKLEIILPKGSTITPDHIEQNIGISKDFNVYELRKAVGEKNHHKAFQILNYFHKNPKSIPKVLLIGQLFGYFSNLLKYHGLKDKTQGNVASALGIHPFFVDEYRIAAANFPMKKVSTVINKLKVVDGMSKGVGASNLEDIELYKEFLISVM